MGIKILKDFDCCKNNANIIFANIKTQLNFFNDQQMLYLKNIRCDLDQGEYITTSLNEFEEIKSNFFKIHEETLSEHKNALQILRLIYEPNNLSTGYHSIYSGITYAIESTNKILKYNIDYITDVTNSLNIFIKNNLFVIKSLSICLFVTLSLSFLQPYLLILCFLTIIYIL